MGDEVAEINPGEIVTDIAEPIPGKGHQIKVDGPAMLF
jgi:hypothetical protein